MSKYKKKFTDTENRLVVAKEEGEPERWGGGVGRG